MSKSLRLYIVLLVLLLIGIVIIDINRPKPINWEASYSIKDKIPLGLYVFDQEIGAVINPQKIKKIAETPYEYLNKLYDYDTLVNDYKENSTLFLVNEFSNLDEESSKELCYYASKGNTVFISSKDFPQILKDTLNFETIGDYEYSDSIFCWMSNKKLDSQKYNLVQGIGNNYFKKIDTLTTTILGYQTGDSIRANFIKIPYFSGNFILHTQPTAFTNFHLLKKNHANYTQNLLSYLPKKNIAWFVKNQDGRIESRSQFRYILAQPSLKWAWYIFVFGMLFFMIFNAKRKQRIVPIFKPLQNTTVEFAKTIGNLYFQEADHQNMIDKKIVFFLEKVRQDYLIDTTKLDDVFIKRLQQKTNKELTIISELVGKINKFRSRQIVATEQHLVNIDKTIESILEKNKS